MEAAKDSNKENFGRFLQSLPEFKTPVEAISELAKHEKVEGRGSWTEEESERELLYWVQLYLTHLGCPLEYIIPCTRAVVADILDGSFRKEDFEAPAPQLTDIENNGNGDEKIDHLHSENNGGASNEVPVLSAKNLYSHAVVKANELLSRWKMNPPNLEPVRLPHEISFHAAKNKRQTMEDRHVIIPDLRALVDLKGITSPVSFYAVYDGHAGHVAAAYAAAHLHRLLCASKHFPERMEEALKDAFLTTDEYYNVKGLRDKDYSGTTAVVTVVYAEKIYIAWVGDSEAAIVQKGLADKLVEPRHTASNEAERVRVENAGGTVIMNQGGWRVGAVLTVTRAIGDSGFKPFVSADPDIKVVQLQGGEEYVILACDGLWDELSALAAMQETNRFLLQNPDRYKEVAKALSDKARKSGSLDNITVIVVFLKPVQEIIAQLQANQESIVGVQIIENPLDTSTNSSVDYFADLADTNVVYDHDHAATNPFDTTPLDPSVLGEFGTPTNQSFGEVDWNFQKSPPEMPTSLNNSLFDEADHAIRVLNQAIEGGDVGSPSKEHDGKQLIDLEDLQYSSERSGTESTNIADESTLDASLVEKEEFEYISGPQAEESLQAAVASDVLSSLTNQLEKTEDIPIVAHNNSSEVIAPEKSQEESTGTSEKALDEKLEDKVPPISSVDTAKESLKKTSGSKVTSGLKSTPPASKHKTPLPPTSSRRTPPAPLTTKPARSAVKVSSTLHSSAKVVGTSELPKHDTLNAKVPGSSTRAPPVTPSRTVTEKKPVPPVRKPVVPLQSLSKTAVATNPLRNESAAAATSSPSPQKAALKSVVKTPDTPTVAGPTHRTRSAAAWTKTPISKKPEATDSTNVEKKKPQATPRTPTVVSLEKSTSLVPKMQLCTPAVAKNLGADSSTSKLSKPIGVTAFPSGTGVKTTSRFAHAPPKTAASPTSKLSQNGVIASDKQESVEVHHSETKKPDVPSRFVSSAGVKRRVHMGTPRPVGKLVGDGIALTPGLSNGGSAPKSKPRTSTASAAKGTLKSSSENGKPKAVVKQSSLKTAVTQESNNGTDSKDKLQVAVEELSLNDRGDGTKANLLESVDQTEVHSSLEVTAVANGGSHADEF